MYIAMNRFKIRPGNEKSFEAIWASRDSHLNDVPGFQEFHLLRGPESEQFTLYSSHTVWKAKENFDDWTQSEAFRKAHKGAGNHGNIYLEHPQFEGFEVVQASKPAHATA